MLAKPVYHLASGDISLKCMVTSCIMLKAQEDYLETEILGKALSVESVPQRMKVTGIWFYLIEICGWRFNHICSLRRLCRGIFYSPVENLTFSSTYFCVPSENSTQKDVFLSFGGWQMWRNRKLLSWVLHILHRFFHSCSQVWTRGFVEIPGGFYGIRNWNFSSALSFKSWHKKLCFFLQVSRHRYKKRGKECFFSLPRFLQSFAQNGLGGVGVQTHIRSISCQIFVVGLGADHGTVVAAEA